MTDATQGTKAIDVAALRALLGCPDKPISQAELAALAGVNQATISRAERFPEKMKGSLATVLRQLEDQARGRAAA